jgi:hypothetical protein
MKMNQDSKFLHKCSSEYLKFEKARDEDIPRFACQSDLSEDDRSTTGNSFSYYTQS